MCYFSKYVSKLSIFGSNVSPFDLGWRNSHFLCWTPTLHSCLHSFNAHIHPTCLAVLLSSVLENDRAADRPRPTWEITVPKYIHLHHHTAQKLTRLLGQRSSVITANLALLQPSRVFHLQGGRACPIPVAHTHTTQVSVPQQPEFIFYFGVIPSKLHRKKRCAGTAGGRGTQTLSYLEAGRAVGAMAMKMGDDRNTGWEWSGALQFDGKSTNTKANDALFIFLYIWIH